MSEIFVKERTSVSVMLNWRPANIPNPVYTISYVEQGNDKSGRNITLPYNVSVTSYNLTKLSPITTYRATIYVKSRNAGIFNPPPNPVTFSTFEGLPTRPVGFKVQLDSLDPTILIASWRTPGDSRGKILRYHLYYQSKDSKDIVYRNFPAEGKTNFTFRLSSQDLSFGKEYEFWVTAFTVAGEGSKTDVKIMVYDTGAIQKAVDALAVTGNGSSALLTWKSPFKDPKIVKDYIVSYQDAWEDEQTKTTTDSHIQIDKLCWGYYYVFDVQAHNDHGTGPSRTIPYKAKGNILEVPNNLTFTSKAPGQLTVRWDQPAGAPADTEYTVYYSYNPIYLEDRNIAKKAFRQSIVGRQDMVITDLRSCESYSFRIAITSPGVCPLSPVHTRQIGPDIGGKPEEVHFSQIDATSGKLTWQAPCPIQVLPVNYMVSVQEGNNKPRTFTPYKNTKNFKLSMSLTKLIRGATYKVLVSSSGNMSSLSEKYVFTIPSIGEPLDFQRIIESDGTVRLAWIRPEDFPKNIPLTYEIYEKQTEFDNKMVHYHQDAKFVYLTKTTNTSVIVTPKPGVKSSYKVRVAAYQGYPGTFSYIVDVAGSMIISEPSKQTIVLSKTNVIAIAVSVSVVVIALVVVLSFFVIRHRRLQRSFLAFANSHYDTRSGTTTFTAANELDEDEDSPMIRGFSDDEPLVIA